TCEYCLIRQCTKRVSRRQRTRRVTSRRWRQGPVEEQFLRKSKLRNPLLSPKRGCSRKKKSNERAAGVRACGRIHLSSIRNRTAFSPPLPQAGEPAAHSSHLSCGLADTNHSFLRTIQLTDSGVFATITPS